MGPDGPLRHFGTLENQAGKTHPFPKVASLDRLVADIGHEAGRCDAVRHFGHLLVGVVAHLVA